MVYIHMETSVVDQAWDFRTGGGGDAVLALYNSWGLGCVGPGESLMVHEGLKNYGIWAGKDLDYATPAVTHGFGLCCRIRLILQQTRGTEDPC